MITRNFGPDHHTLTVGVDIPAGDIEFTLRGGKGANKTGAGGLGATVQGTLSVSVGDTLDLYVGAAGGSSAGGSQHGGGANGGDGGSGFLEGPGGGGGAATDLRLNGTDPTNRVAVAGGGGGAASSQAGGYGGHPSGGVGETGILGGSQTQDGAGGSTIRGRGGQSGTLGSGFGGAGGGGGWFGGGGSPRGTAGSVKGGGGGSSWTDPALVTGVTHTNGDNDGPGSASISYPFTMLVTTPWSGGVTEDSAVVIAKVADPGADVDLVVSPSSDLSGATEFGPFTSDADGWLRFEASGLTADTLYYFAPQPVGGDVDLSRTGKFRTHPPVGTPHSFTFAVGADAGQGGTAHQWPAMGSRVSNAPVFDVIKSHDPLFFGFVGDFHYRDLGDGPVDESSDDYRETYESITTAPIRSAFHRDVPLAFMFDNHDSQALGFGSLPDSHTASGVDPTYRQCVPSYPVVAGKLWQSWQIGRVLFVMTDNRSHRTSGPPATMLGAEQKQWFFDTITNTSAELIVWLQSDSWADVAEGGWGAHPVEQAEIGTFIANSGRADRMIAVTGNTHYCGYHAGGSWNPHGGFREFMISGIDILGGSPKSSLWIDTSPGIQSDLWAMIEIEDDGEEIGVRLDGFRFDQRWGTYTFFSPARSNYFDFGYHTWVVPAGVTAVHFDIRGAKGGDIGTAFGGHGARVEGTLAVSPGDTLQLFAGNHGQYGQTSGDQENSGGADGGTGGANGGSVLGGWAGAGGGAATDIRLNGTSLAHRVAVAGGGGGAARSRDGGGGGYPTGIAGQGNGTHGGGTQTQDGAGGTTVNGRGGQAADLSYYNGGGGGGGGFFGGGGGANGGNSTGGGAVGSGGGGSSWTHPSLVYSVVHTNDANPAPGTILLTWVE